MPQLYTFYLLNSINFVHIQQVREEILSRIQNVVGTCQQITILVRYQVSSTLVTLLCFIYYSVKVCNFLVRTVCCKLMILSFRSSLCLLRKGMLSSRLTLFKLSPLFGSDPVTILIWLVFLDLRVLNILPRTMAYAS
jgi:hypothetical protein